MSFLKERELGREFLREVIRGAIAETGRALDRGEIEGTGSAYIVGNLVGQADFDDDEQAAILAQLDVIAARAFDRLAKAAG